MPLDGESIQSKAFKGMWIAVTLDDTTKPPGVGIGVQAGDNPYRAIIVPLADWAEIVQTVENLKQKLEIY